MVLEPDTGRCASEEIVPRRGVDMRRCASKDGGPRKGVDLVGVPHRLDKGTSVCEDAGCHSHARPGRVAHDHIPMPSQTLYVFRYCSALLLYF